MPRCQKTKSEGVKQSSSVQEFIVPPRFPLYVPKFNITLERAQEIMQQLQPLPLKPLISPNEPYKHLSVDRNFIAILDDLKPTQIPWQKPENFLTEEEHKEWNATRMREYRRKSNETLEKTKIMLDGLKAQCAVNTVMLKNILNNKTVEEQVKMNAAQFLKIEVGEVMEIPEILQMFQPVSEYWRRRKIASESHFEQKSLIYLERVISLQKDYSDYKAKRINSRSPSQLIKKIKDAVMKAESYEFFMDDKRVRKVIGEMQTVDFKFKQNVGTWLVQQLKSGGSEGSLLST